MIEIENADINKVEEVHQRSFLISGKCGGDHQQNSFVSIQVVDERANSVFPEQRWPLSLGRFKALVLLAPGLNKIIVTSGRDAASKTELSLRYTPILQTPPLHLAILVAKDSPLLIDCPSAKFGHVSSAHSSLNAAIAKLRVAAYMWQALAADNLYWEGLPRRSFRIEEEFGPDTLSRQAQQNSFGKHQIMDSVPRIHIIRTEKTVAQLRDVEAELEAAKSDELRQKRHKDLYRVISKAVKISDGPLHSNNKPVVAALVLDAHFNENLGRTFPDAQFSIHKSEGLSVAMFGSQSTYSWPRFVDEIPDCLLDPTPVDGTVSREGSEKPLSMWQACSVSQGRFYREIIRAFDPAEDTLGRTIEDNDKWALKGSQWGHFQWPKLFLSRSLSCAGADDDEEKDPRPISANLAKDSYYQIKLKQALVLCNSITHFQLPGYVALPNDAPSIRPVVEDSDDGRRAAQKVEIKCEAGLASIWVCGKNTSMDYGVTWPGEPLKSVTLSLEEMKKSLGPYGSEQEEIANGGLDRIEALAMNGQQRTFRNISSLLRVAAADYIVAAIPGTNLRFTKTCVDSTDDNDSTRSWGINHDWKWTVLLKRRSNRKGTKWEGSIVNASMIDVRVGCGLDGAVVYYEDGSRVPCGPWREGTIRMGGHQARKVAIRPGVEVVKVGVARYRHELYGLRVWLSDGQGRGSLNLRELRDLGGDNVKFLEPPANHKIVGFYGTSGSWGMCKKFGILTVPRDVDLPDTVYDMEQFQNLPLSHYAERQEGESVQEEEDDAMEEDVEEESDAGYDEDWDAETLQIYGK
ncbi:putative peptidase family-domain-containing protein [Triangularia verruculosa]|uniref:Peptidase family-domain-containing protein n=1 Tax=Triangularia verruculosa TaxID=2587418 RepID=A0AAN6XKK8_9PEZI|nr:putative peptidase family-domain-containing protein [Triangularia verruculosa]